MIYRGVKMDVEEKKKGWRNWLKAVGIALAACAVIAAIVFGISRLGIR